MIWFVHFLPLSYMKYLIMILDWFLWLDIFFILWGNLINLSPGWGRRGDAVPASAHHVRPSPSERREGCRCCHRTTQHCRPLFWWHAVQRPAVTLATYPTWILHVRTVTQWRCEVWWHGIGRFTDPSTTSHYLRHLILLIRSTMHFWDSCAHNINLTSGLRLRGPDSTWWQFCFPMWCCNAWRRCLEQVPLTPSVVFHCNSSEVFSTSLLEDQITSYLLPHCIVSKLWGYTRSKIILCNTV